MSIVTYNGITLPYANTTWFSQDPIRDDQGQIDWCVTRFSIAVQCYLSSDYLLLLAPDLIQNNEELTDNPALIMKVLRTRLMEHRKRLSYTFNDVELIPENQVGINGQVDARNGPMPQSCQIISLTNSTFLIRFHIVAHYWENNNVEQTNPATVTNLRGGSVLSNRWSESVQIDDCGYSLRVRQGKFVIRSDNGEGKTADHYRVQFAVVSVPQGFVREQSSYDLSPDGLGLQYRIIDREVFKQPPFPAFRADGKYYETVTNHGAKRYGEVHITLRSTKYINQVELIDKAIGIAASKLIINGAEGLTNFNAAKAFGKLELCSIVVDMYDNSVQCQMRCLMAATTLAGSKKRLHGVAGLRGGKAMAFTPFSDSKDGVGTSAGPLYYARGSAGLLLVPAAYYDPSLANALSKLGPGEFYIKDPAPTTKSDGSGPGNVQTGGERGVSPGEGAFI